MFACIRFSFGKSSHSNYALFLYRTVVSNIMKHFLLIILILQSFCSLAQNEKLILTESANDLWFESLCMVITQSVGSIYNIVRHHIKASVAESVTIQCCIDTSLSRPNKKSPARPKSLPGFRGMRESSLTGALCLRGSGNHCADGTRT